MSKNPPSKTVSRHADTGRYVQVGGATVKVLNPKTTLSSKDTNRIREAVRGHYADKKSK